MAVTTEPENPLTEGLERLPVHPTALVVFGATGDLAKRKLLPAIYNLAHEGALPERFYLVGVSRSEMRHEEFREMAVEAITSFSRRTPDQDVLEHLLEDVRYVPGSFDDEAVYATLVRDARRVRREGRAAAQPRLLPVDRPGVLPDDRRSARRRGPAAHADAEVRVIIEKPFGTTLARGAGRSTARCCRCSPSARSSASTTTSARRPCRTCSRFALPTACSSRCGTATTSTTSRSPRRRTSASAPAPATTTRAGALRDLIQNHMLQLLTLLCMEPPVAFSADEVRDEKVKVLHAVHAPRRPRRSQQMAVRAQYGAGRGGRRAGARLPRRRTACRPDSNTETYAALRLQRRQLALGRGAVLPAHRQAPRAQADRDRHHAQARPAPRVPGGRRGRAPQPADPDDAAQRGRVAVAGRQGAGHAHDARRR